MKGKNFFRLSFTDKNGVRLLLTHLCLEKPSIYQSYLLNSNFIVFIFTILIRYLYIMDETVDKQKLDELVQKQIELVMPASVFKLGELGSYRNLIQENNETCGNETNVTYTQLISNIRWGKIVGQTFHPIIHDKGYLMI